SISISMHWHESLAASDALRHETPVATHLVNKLFVFFAKKATLKQLCKTIIYLRCVQERLCIKSRTIEIRFLQRNPCVARMNAINFLRMSQKKGVFNAYILLCSSQLVTLFCPGDVLLPITSVPVFVSTHQLYPVDGFLCSALNRPGLKKFNVDS